MTTADMIHKLRVDKGITQTELAYQLSQLKRTQEIEKAKQEDLSPAVLKKRIEKIKNEEDFVKGVNISKWEKGAIPRVYTMQLLAEYFEVTTSLLLGGEAEQVDDYVPAMNVPYGEYRTIPIEFLNRFRNLPIWIEKDNTKKGYFALVDEFEDRIILSNGATRSFADIKGVVKIGPSPFSISMANLDERPLDMIEIRHNDRIWIEFISGPQEIRDAYRGWYDYDAESRNFFDSNKMPIPDALYGKMFVGFLTALPLKK